MARFLSYEEVLQELGSGRKHLLLGNGFSIGCDPVFRYDNLYDWAVSHGLSQRAQKVFGKIGTNNFEAVMKLLDEAYWVSGLYGMPNAGREGMLKDLDIIKKTLIEAVARTHLEHTGKVSDGKKEAARKFLQPYWNVFTTNYDLLLYWVVMSAGNKPLFQDGFGNDFNNPDSEYVVFQRQLGSEKGMFFLHGALHLFMNGRSLCKHTWSRTDKRLTDSIRSSLDGGNYPLFVAEGTPDKKVEQIARNGYLWYCMHKFSRITKSLVIYGHSLGESDDYIAEIIARNRRIKHLYIGLHGDPDSVDNLKIRDRATHIQSKRDEHSTKKPSPLSVAFYDSAGARVWG